MPDDFYQVASGALQFSNLATGFLLWAPNLLMHDSDAANISRLEHRLEPGPV